MDIYSSHKMTLNIIEMLSESLHEEINLIEKNLLRNLKIYEENNHSYNKFLSNHDGPLFSEFGTQLNQMLKDIKILTTLKKNELSSMPKSNSEIFTRKSFKRNQPNLVEKDQYGNISRTITPLTSNKSGYQLIEQTNFENGQKTIFVTNTAEEIFSHERKNDPNLKFSKELPSPDYNVYNTAAKTDYGSVQSEESRFEYRLNKNEFYAGGEEQQQSNAKSLISDFPENDWIEGNLSIKRQSMLMMTPETPIRGHRKTIVITSAKRSNTLDEEPQDLEHKTSEFEEDFGRESETVYGKLKKSYEDDFYKEKSNNTISFKEDLNKGMNFEGGFIPSNKSSMTNLTSQNCSKVEISPMKLMKESYHKKEHTPSKSLQSSHSFFKTSKDPNLFFKSLSQSFTIPLKYNQIMTIINNNTLKIEDIDMIEIFSDVYHKPKIGINSGKGEQKVTFTKSKNECIFFNNKYQICALNLSVPGQAIPRYFMDEQVELVDFVVDEIEQRVVVLNEKGNIYYKNLFSDYLAEDQSLMNLGKIRGKAISMSNESRYLLIGYETDFFDGTHEDNIIIRKKSPITGYFEPFTAAYLSSLNGNFLSYFS